MDQGSVTGRRFLALAAVIAVAAGLGGWAVAQSDSGATMPAQDIAAGKALYAAHCAACHGANLEGQADWKSAGPDGRMPAPPHDATGHTWHHADSMLFNYIKLGGAAVLAESGVTFDSGMPGFAGVLTDAEINDILVFIKSTWPERERKFQEGRSRDAAG